ncbi:MAG: helix-turn-helix domain-containing protein [Myxococcales bacterium]|nr:helix-turn-helix domain-containing protein [Myxococcales bacterium]
MGATLRAWRTERGLTQRALAEAAGITAKHVSFIETGRAQPSRVTLLALSRALQLSPHDRQALLGAAGHAPARREPSLDAAGVDALREALEVILTHHEPCPSVAIDRAWYVVMVNEAFASFAGAAGVPLPAPLELARAPHTNLLELLVDERALRPSIENWEAVVRVSIARARRELTAHGDPRLRDVLHRATSRPDVADVLERATVDPGYLLPLVVRAPDGGTRQLLGTVTTLGTALDAAVREMRIETYVPWKPSTPRR